MRSIRTKSVCLLSLILITINLKAQRKVLPLMNGWKFVKEDVALSAPTEKWENVVLPHTWNKIDGEHPLTDAQFKSTNPALAKTTDGKSNDAEPKGVSEVSKYWRGAAWYNHMFFVPDSWKGHRVFIHFQAASIVADTYFNGVHLGQHRGAFTGFTYELTPNLRFGVQNDLRVRVDNSYHDDIPPLSGDLNMFGGLYRGAALIITANDCISPLDLGSSGVYISTTQVKPGSATIEVRTIISAGHTPPPPLFIATSIQDAKGRTIISKVRRIDMGDTAVQTITQSICLSRPHLWNGLKDPYLYSVHVRLMNGKAVTDEVDQPLGIRTFEISQQKGFVLNGKPYPIYGVCRTQERYPVGWALTPKDEDDDEDMILRLGATAIRNDHNPPDEYWHILSDKSGLLQWDELPLVNETRRTQAFYDNARQQMREMIAQLYNHPSIVFWSLFNELGNFPTRSPDSLIRSLNDIAKQMNPYRITVAASDHTGTSYNKIPDEIAFNHYPDWYTDDNMGDYIADRYKEIGRRIALSEYGAGGDPSQHEDDFSKKPHPTGGGHFHPEEYQAYVHEKDYAQIKDNPDLWGSFIWVMFDFASSKKNEGTEVGVNDKGLVTHDHQTAKDAYFFYKANWNPQPIIYIASKRFTERKNAHTFVKVYTNAPRVALRINGRFIGEQKPNKINVCLWPDIVISKGKNIIHVNGKYKNKNIDDTCEWTLE
jgi:beta-galactosidase